VTAGHGLGAALDLDRAPMMDPTSAPRPTASAHLVNPAGNATAVLRRAGSGDREPLRQFLTGLSPLSRQQRFFTGAAPTRERDLDVLLCDGRPGTAVVATSGPEIVGHAMWAPVTGAPSVGEVGVVVADQHRRRGIGTGLLLAVLADAHRAGVHTLEALVLPSNEALHRLIRDLLPHLVPEPDEDLLRYRITVADHVARAA
jgi:GNAT superfamily N-acetyltransferase